MAALKRVSAHAASLCVFLLCALLALAVLLFTRSFAGFIFTAVAGCVFSHRVFEARATLQEKRAALREAIDSEKR